MRFLLVVFAVLASPSLAQGRLAFDAERHDVGTIAEGDTAVHVFSFTNAGDAPLELAAVEASCGCTVPSYTTDPVAPGARGEIAVAYDSGGRPGPFESVVHVAARGASPSDAVLRIAGTATPAFALTGTTLGGLVFADAVWDMGGADPDGFVQHAFRFLNAAERPVRILSARSSHPAADLVTPGRPIFPGDIASVVVTAERAAGLANADGAIELVITVDTDDPQRPVKELRVVGRLAEAGE